MNIEGHISEILTIIGEDSKREGLVKTPARVEKSFGEIFSGYGCSGEDVLGSAIFATKNSEMVMVKDIPFYSMCEHHMLPFFGVVHVAYIPNGKIVGLSKIPKTVDIYSKRLQVQENLTEDIVDAMVGVLNPLGAGVVIEARHLCMEMRGVNKTSSYTKTSALRGTFLSDRVRKEFFSLIGSREGRNFWWIYEHLVVKLMV